MSPRAWAAFAAMSVLWGVSYLFIKVAVDGGLPPAFVAWSRILLAAVVLGVLAVRAGVLGGLRGRWRWVLAYAVCEMTLPFPLIAAGEQQIDSSLAAIIIAAAPLLVAVLALRFDPGERVTGLRLLGLLVGFAGVIALVGIDVAGSTKALLGALAVLLAALGYAAGPMILSRHLAHLDPRATMGASLAMAAVLLTPLTAATLPSDGPTTGAVVAIAVLGLLCTAAAFVIFNGLIAEVGAGRALVITYVNPVVAVAAGMIFLDERPGAGAIAGLLLILTGSWLATDGRLPPLFGALRGRRRLSRT
jgi:drug/metabolite transporter (DMT)-like permease